MFIVMVQISFAYHAGFDMCLIAGIQRMEPIHERCEGARQAARHGQEEQ
jgi:hypothetical protein